MGAQAAVEVTNTKESELLGARNHLHATVVHDDLPGLQLRKITGNIPKCIQKEPVGQLEDIGLMDAMNCLPACLLGPFKRKAQEAPTGFLRDDLEALHHS